MNNQRKETPTTIPVRWVQATGWRVRLIRERPCPAGVLQDRVGQASRLTRWHWMSRDSQIRRTNVEIRRKTEARTTKGPWQAKGAFDIRALDFFRHLSLVIRQQVHGRKACTKRRKGALHEIPSRAGGTPAPGHYSWQ